MVLTFADKEFRDFRRYYSQVDTVKGYLHIWVDDGVNDEQQFDYELATAPQVTVE